MIMFCNLPTKSERFAVVSVRLTAEQLQQVVHEVFDDALIWHDEPRQWLTYGSFLGLQIHKAMISYSIGRNHTDEKLARQEIDEFVAACQNYALEMGETL